jgi:hypothetical protein
MKKALYTLCFLWFGCSSPFLAQKNYTVEYDKLSDGVTYYSSEWVKGEMVTQQVDQIKVDQNDIVTLRVLNVNPFAFDTEVVQEFVEIKQKDNPLFTILKTFGAGMPALNLLGSLSHSAPSNLEGRGGSDALKEYKANVSNLVLDIHELLTEITATYVAVDQAEAIKYSKSSTKEEIVNELTFALEKVEVEDISAKLNQLEDKNEALETLLDKNLLDNEDDLWFDIDRVYNDRNQFDETFKNDYDEYKTIEPGAIIQEVQEAEFMVEHIYKSSARSGRYQYERNDYFLLFRDATNEEGTKNALVDHAKLISLEVKQAYKPYWSVGVDYVIPFAGHVEYVVSQVEGDYSAGTPDSLSVSEGASSAMQLTIGTKLCFDIPTKTNFSPSALLGLSLGGLNNLSEEGNLNVLLGAGFGIKSFPYLSINTGISFSQLELLKDDYRLNSTFAEPDEIERRDYSPLFENKFKPGFFFGISIRF